jgi:hypothetical protein
MVIVSSKRQMCWSAASCFFAESFCVLRRAPLPHLVWYHIISQYRNQGNALSRHILPTVSSVDYGDGFRAELERSAAYNAKHGRSARTKTRPARPVVHRSSFTSSQSSDPNKQHRTLRSKGKPKQERARVQQRSRSIRTVQKRPVSTLRASLD